MFIDDHLHTTNFNSNVFYIQVIYKQFIINATEQNAKNKIEIVKRKELIVDPYELIDDPCWLLSKYNNVDCWAYVVVVDVDCDEM